MLRNFKDLKVWQKLQNKDSKIPGSEESSGEKIKIVSIT
jgi:hypothetical protein